MVVSSWLEGDSTQSFFEFQMSQDKEVEKAFRNVELLAAKNLHGYWSSSDSHLLPGHFLCGTR